MPNHSIGSAVFEHWEGDPPHMVQQIVESFTRPGVAGIGQQLAGIRGEQFEAVLTAHFSSYNAAINAAGAYRSLVGAGLVIVVYNLVDLFATFQHKFTVDQFYPIRIQAGIFIGPSIIPGVDYYYPNGAEVVGRFLMTPFKV